LEAFNFTSNPDTYKRLLNRLDSLKEKIQKRTKLSNKEQAAILEYKCNLYISAKNERDAAEIWSEIKNHMEKFNLAKNPKTYNLLLKRLDEQRLNKKTNIQYLLLK